MKAPSLTLGIEEEYQIIDPATGELKSYITQILEDGKLTLKEQIKAIYDQHKGRYGYRRITAMLRRQGVLINHKTVQRLMGDLNIKSIVRLKKYRSYRGEVGQTAPNLLERDFRRLGQTRNG